ncbi:MAG: hypothetical protein N838_13130 [Thiohalocapsa sp. PB-PSB1]|jgi:hypothetical protein|nr:MAG: hypothetical protein N838_13130 [Thiohalocapsa sp. PB-PSB1]
MIFLFRGAMPSAFALFALIGSFTAAAQNRFDDARVLPEAAPIAPLPPTSDTLIDPEVTITETDTEVIYEYRVNGQLYMVKVQPVIGPPYYMMDIDGDGQLDVQDQSPPELAVPQWLLFSW